MSEFNENYINIAIFGGIILAQCILVERQLVERQVVERQLVEFQLVERQVVLWQLVSYGNSSHMATRLMNRVVSNGKSSNEPDIFC
jgi:hypothetical protein